VATRTNKPNTPGGVYPLEIAIFILVTVATLFTVLAFVALPAFALWDIFRRAGAQWRAAGDRRGGWVAAVLFGGPIGAVIYLTTARRRLNEVERRCRSPHERS